MAERLFFALWPDPGVRRQLAQLARRHRRPGGREHHPEDLHLTLAFLGPLTPEQAACARQAAGRIHSDPFELTLDRLGYWPRPRVLWCGPSHSPAALKGLVSGLWGELGAACGLVPETRPYKPHVTLVRKQRQPAAGPLQPSIEWSAREFVLATSGGGPPRGPRYRVLARWPLG